ncbi:flagellar biosynthetic protein FliR [Alicyclobacillaceae bacterium I2511]|jgi:flagellar biosynthetic protein FliR|nr:flagellar biosynthetic protein FliR [Alicyclobacillaceae bacterium I2511]
MVIVVQHLSLYLLILLRMAGFIGTSPVLSSRLWPTPVKIGLAVFLTLVVAPGVSGNVPDITTQTGKFVVMALQEAVIGMAVGWIVTLGFSALQVAGQVFDLQIGFAAAMLYDPQQGEEEGLTSTLLTTLFTLYFLGLNGLDGLLLALMGSYRQVGLGALHLPVDTWRVLSTMLDMGMQVSIEITAPFLAALVLTNVTLAFLSRAVPQMNVFVVGLPAQLLVGLVALALGMPGVVYLFGKLFALVFSQMTGLLQWLGG